LNDAATAISSMLDSSSSDQHLTPGLQTLAQVQPFVEICAPLVQQVGDALSGIGVLVGRETKIQDSGASSVAMVLQMKKLLEEDVVLPLNELHYRTQNRENLLVKMQDGNVEQLKKLKVLIDDLRITVQNNKERELALTANAKLLAMRSEATLTACKDVGNSLTLAEKEYFTQLKTWEGQCSRWELDLKELGQKSTKIADDSNDSKPKFELSEDQGRMCEDLLMGQAQMLTKCRGMMEDVWPEGLEEEFEDDEDEENQRF
jgi:hypothetical protein